MFHHTAKLNIFTSFILSSLIVFSSVFFLYKLGMQSLHPWDEAWYASISKNVLESKDIFDLKYNTFSYWDHPPLGFYLETVSFSILGINEFAARLPQALLGITSIGIIFLTGKKMGSNWIAFSAALILLSCRWFLFRARSGNLDILLVFTQLLVFYFSLEPKLKRHFYLLWASFALSLLAKSFISITLLPLVIFPTWQFLNQKKLSKSDLYKILILFLLILSPWYIFNTFKYGLVFLKRNLFEIGFREGSASGIGITTINKTLSYLHAACHKWYKLFLLSTIGLFFLTILNKNKKNTLLLTYLFLVSFPYFLSSKAEIWHLIPILAPLSLIIPTFIFRVLNIFTQQNIYKIFASIIIISISFYSLKSYWQEFININAKTSDIAILAKKIPSDKNIYFSSDDYFPSFVFYADLEKPMLIINKYDYQNICEINKNNFYAVIMSGDWLDQKEVKKKTIAKQANFKILEFNDGSCEDAANNL